MEKEATGTRERSSKSSSWYLGLWEAASPSSGRAERLVRTRTERQSGCCSSCHTKCLPVAPVAPSTTAENGVPPAAGVSAAAEATGGSDEEAAINKKKDKKKQKRTRTNKKSDRLILF